ncbi:DUF447 domain-containing protein [Halapricum hydrolyticum]|uniref:DUF447 family protein n=1 Tax=Halapricum hydrolyticum TaxID=2979991 RepID=A0AAE3IFE5_9EURY|nr:DUF447 domain-containing protein [Halapricum hydrolyticum]MCU4719249.1 DUF447 family protein [Halapricum hydrolyticum]MCU4728318.1 DUF447 family protein [Halapricum hydrolyticum]
MSDDHDGAQWAVELRGVTESVVTTRGPNGRWNVAALGLHAGDPVTARTWGRTRTRRNFEARGRGYVQFAPDPVAFAEAALTIREESDPILDSTDAWVEIEPERRASGTEGGTEWVDWELHPVESQVVRQGVRTTNRGYYAVIEATVAASRLGVETYDQGRLRERLDYFEGVVETCGGEHEHEAFEIVRANADW